MPSVGKEIRNTFPFKQLPQLNRKKVGIILQDITFLLPHCFVLRVILPLNFIELRHTVSSHSFFFVQDLDMMLNIRQVGLEGKSFKFHHFIGDLQAFL